MSDTIKKKTTKNYKETPFSDDTEVELGLNNALVLAAKWKRLEGLGPNRGHALLSFSNGLLETLREILETKQGEPEFCSLPELVLCLLSSAAIIMVQDISPDSDASMKTFLRAIVRARAAINKTPIKFDDDTFQD